MHPSATVIRRGSKNQPTGCANSVRGTIDVFLLLIHSERAAQKCKRKKDKPHFKYLNAASLQTVDAGRWVSGGSRDVRPCAGVQTNTVTQ